MASFSARLKYVPQEVRGAWAKKRDFSDAVFSDPVSPVRRLVRVNSPELDADTQYYYTLEIDGVLQKRRVGRTLTAPTPGTPKSFSFWAASCARTGSDHPVFRWLGAQNLALGIHMGDFHYRNISSGTGSGDDERRMAYDAVFASRGQRALFEGLPHLPMMDDHDFTGNNTGEASPGRASACRTFRQRFPMPYAETSNSTDALYYSYEYGRVIFIVTDLRSRRSDNSDADNASKSMMGTAQKAWFKSLLADPAHEGKLFCWVSTTMWNWYEPDRNDSWTGFTTERDELANFFKDNDLTRRLFIVQGDAHHTGIDSGSSTDFATGGGAGLVLGAFAPLDASLITPGNAGSWDVGLSGDRNGQVGLIHISDNGGDTIGVRLEAWRGIDEEGSGFERAFFYDWQADVSE